MGLRRVSHLDHAAAGEATNLPILIATDWHSPTDVVLDPLPLLLEKLPGPVLVGHVIPTGHQLLDPATEVVAVEGRGGHATAHP